jgi:uncharacterized membrane protein YGL010W
MVEEVEEVQVIIPLIPVTAFTAVLLDKVVVDMADSMIQLNQVHILLMLQALIMLSMEYMVPVAVVEVIGVPTLPIMLATVHLVLL